MLPGILLDISTTPATQEGAVDFTWLFAKMLIVLIVVCLLVVVILKYIAPRMGLFKRFGGGKYIEVVARQGLDQRKHLYLIKVGPKYALIGTADHGVSLVMELNPEDIEIE